MILKKINKEDLIFSGELGDDRTNTLLTLDDYDWMNYELRTSFNTEETGEFNVAFKYIGCTESFMQISRFNASAATYSVQEYAFPSSIFQKYIIRFMQKHIDSWDQHEAFCGEGEVIDFYNEVIDYLNSTK